MNSLNRTSKFAGLIYLSIALLAGFSMMYVPTRLFVPDNPTLTIQQIGASEQLLRWGIVVDSFIFLLEIVLVGLLYRLLYAVNPMISFIAASARLAMTIIQGLNLLPYLTILLLLSNSGTSNDPSQNILLLYHVHELGVLIWQLFFGLHLFLLSYLLFKSGYIPKILALGASVAACGYWSDSFGSLLLPAQEALFNQIVIILATIPELVLTLWLLIKGLKPSNSTHSNSTINPQIGVL